MTELEWKKKADSQRLLLTNFILCWHPANRNIKPQLPITAPGAEKACAAIRADIANEMDSFVLQLETRIADAFASENPSALYSLLNSAWFGVPESTSCWSLDGFNEAVNLLEDPPEPDYEDQLADK